MRFKINQSFQQGDKIILKIQNLTTDCDLKCLWKYLDMDNFYLNKALQIDSSQLRNMCVTKLEMKAWGQASQLLRQFAFNFNVFTTYYEKIESFNLRYFGLKMKVLKNSDIFLGGLWKYLERI